MKGLVLLLFILAFTSSSAQDAPCAQIIQKSYQSESRSLLRNNDIIIPVVFHIVYRNEEQNISQEIIDRQLEILNADFNLKNTEIIPSQSLGNIGIVGFQFKLAEINPDGDESNGIVRIETDIENIGNSLINGGISQIKQEDFGGSSPWPTENYLNIWVGERTLSLGYTFSSNSVGSDINGIILDYRTLTNHERTLTHEMGHFFGLLHPWGNRTGCDGEEDGIADTPFQAYPDFNCEPITECGVTSKTGNFMDFNSDDCLLYFTKGQAVSIHQFTNQNMLELIKSNDCFISNFPEEEFQFYYNPSYKSIEIYFPLINEVTELRLYTLDGKRILSTSSKSESYINISTNGIPVGFYVLQFKMGDNQIARKIFIY